VTNDPPAYAELDLVTNFSFLEGGSSAEELVVQAKAVGLSAIGVADRNTLAGVVRALAASEKHGLPFLVGCRLAFLDGTELIVYPRDRAAYGRLCRLLSIGKSAITEAVLPDQSDRIDKGDCRLSFDQAAELGEGLIGLVPAPVVINEAFEARLAAWRKAWPDALYLAAAPLHRGDDRARLARLARIAERCGTPLVATNAVLYHHSERRPLQDVLTCIREKTTIDEAGFRLQANAERFLKPPAEMARLFKGHEDALARTLEIVAACTFSLRELGYVYPDEPVPPGKTPDQHLRNLTFQGIRKYYPEGAPPKVVDLVRRELKLIRKLEYANYFLTVHDVVRHARDVLGILCQGRGSAANSAVCFCLGVTSVDPNIQDVLFERFISENRGEPPDIDVDFEHERREEVMQYVYARYGRHRAAICATVIHYRPRSAIRDVGKALGLTEDVTSALANTIWGSYGHRVEDGHVDRLGLKREDPRLAKALELTAELIMFPRHLSQHVGGFVLTQGPLVETVPIGNGAMADRTFIEWDKDDIDELKLMKVDVLALGMLTAMQRGFDLIERHYGKRWDLVGVPKERAEVYDMLCEADSIGVFQVESRAQMSMLPRLQPRKFYDLVVEVAIVRPGPIQGNMVHPYLSRRQAMRDDPTFEIDFPAPAEDRGPPNELRDVLEKTMGVPLFQEQAMRIAMAAAKFTGDEANDLRRAMATFRANGRIGDYRARMVGKMVERGYDPEFAENCFKQIEGFSNYGFPESHACSFALLVYISAWMKCFYPEVFAAALLNSQPMGFYAPAQLVGDARKHGVEARYPDINASDWDCTLEYRPDGEMIAAELGEGQRTALRLGFRQIDGFKEKWAEDITEARRAGGPFASLDDVRRRAGLPAHALDALAAADALGSLNLARRPALWAARGLPRAAPAPLFVAAGLEEADGAPPAALPTMPASEEVVGDYETIRLSLKAHPVSFLRERLARRGAITTKAVDKVADGRRIAVAGVVLVRQRPGSAKGVVFMTVEDETGIANAVVWPKVFERFRPQVMGAKLVMVRGKVQRAPDSEGRVTHIVAEAIEDLSEDLRLLSETPRLKPALAHADATKSASPERGEQQYAEDAIRRHPRNVRVLPRSRDFH
jgi:error-prone DNA polymerase